MKIFDKTKSFAPDIFFRHYKEKIFLGATLLKTIKTVPTVVKFMIQTQLRCVIAAYCKKMQNGIKHLKLLIKDFFCIFQFFLFHVLCADFQKHQNSGLLGRVVSC